MEANNDNDNDQEDPRPPPPRVPSTLVELSLEKLSRNMDDIDLADDDDNVSSNNNATMTILHDTVLDVLAWDVSQGSSSELVCAFCMKILTAIYRQPHLLEQHFADDDDDDTNCRLVLDCFRKAMEHHADSAAVLIHGADLVRGMGVSTSNKEKVSEWTENGGLETMIRATQFLRNERSVQSNWCFVLFVLSQGIPTKVVELGGIETMVAAMTSFSDDDRIQIFGCQTFTTLSLANVENRRRILHADGLSAAACAYKKYYRGDRLLREAVKEAINAIITEED